MQVPSFCGVHGMPSTVGNSLGPPPYTAPDCGGEGATACPPPEVPLTQTPAKSLGTVPLGHAEAGAAVAHRPALKKYHALAVHFDGSQTGLGYSLEKL